VKMGRVILVLGTTSGAGKSTLVAAICRYLARRGVRVAPFKAQNMSLNACAVEGGEMAWAQVIQAWAAGVEPRVQMNPVLLKPLGSARSELILLGRSAGVVESTTFDAYRAQARLVAYEALRGLLEEYDLVVAEGAGSPAEVNLKEMDFVNTGLMREFQAPSILVADIDRGGVFASILGTLELFTPQERKLLAGFIINKFRGSLEILKPGLDFLEERTGKPVLAVFPYLDKALPPEDSLDIQDGGGGKLKVAVVRYPHISNFSDLTPLALEPQVTLIYTQDPLEVAAAHLVILPGSRATLADLRWMKDRGLDLAVKLARRRGAWVLGLCGGYQMLGDELEDSVGTDGGGREEGLGLLPLSTLMTGEKRVRPVRVRRAVDWSWMPERVDGYEIHAGKTRGGAPLFYLEEGGEDGAWGERVLGTYIHDLLAQDSFRRAFLNLLEAESRVDYRVYLREAMDALADMVEAHPFLVEWLESMTVK